MQERRTALISAAVTGKIDVRHWHPPVVSKLETTPFDTA
jgi:type I restriction enzyme S subunit